MPGWYSITDRAVLGSWLCLSLSLSLAPAVVADDALDIRIRSEAIHSDNGALAPSAAAQSDWIARNQLNSIIRFERERHKFDSDYRITDLNFSKNTQTDNTVVEGESEWFWEPVDERFSVTAEHSRFQLVKDSTERFTQDNLDERTIVSVAPKSRIKLSGVDRLELSTNWTDVSFGDGGSLDSERWINQLSWVHALSPISSTYLVLSHQNVDFDSERADYDYYQVSGIYERRLRHLDWSVRVGRNRIERDTGSEISGSSYGFTLNWYQGFHSVEMALLADVTDTSLGNANSLLVGGDLDLGNRLDFDNAFRDPEASDRTSTEMAWKTQNWVCEFCYTRVFYRDVSEDFLSSDVRREQTITSMALTLRPKYDRRYIFSYESYDVERDTSSQQFEQNEARWKASIFHKPSKEMELGFQLSWRERDQADSDATDSEELRSILSLEYILF